jgi:hypothetical protein
MKAYFTTTDIDLFAIFTAFAAHRSLSFAVVCLYSPEGVSIVHTLFTGSRSSDTTCHGYIRMHLQLCESVNELYVVCSRN